MADHRQSLLVTVPSDRRADDDLGIDRVPRPIASRAREVPDGQGYDRHRHNRAQLLFASRGTMVVTTDHGIWVVPPQRAVWIPAFVDHAVLARSQLSLRSLYFRPDLAPNMPETCAVVTVTPLLRELILAAMTLPVEYDEDGPDGRLVAVLLDRLQTVPATPLHLPMPGDPRLKPIVDGLSTDPADRRSLDQWSRRAGASARTLSRLFVAETGMTFRDWRQQVRLLEALARLGDGQPVTAVAMDLGYDSQSAFIAMFKRALGRTPGKYFATA
ncbi:MAG: helix-turn-helix transcriptional regulator [Rhodospirillaceae bacterium]